MVLAGAGSVAALRSARLVLLGRVAAWLHARGLAPQILRRYGEIRG
jgi:hypothetical protein